MSIGIDYSIPYDIGEKSCRRLYNIVEAYVYIWGAVHRRYGGWNTAQSAIRLSRAINRALCIGKHPRIGITGSARMLCSVCGCTGALADDGWMDGLSWVCETVCRLRRWWTWSYILHGHLHPCYYIVCVTYLRNDNSWIHSLSYSAVALLTRRTRCIRQVTVMSCCPQYLPPPCWSRPILCCGSVNLRSYRLMLANCRGWNFPHQSKYAVCDYIMSGFQRYAYFSVHSNQFPYPFP